MAKKTQGLKVILHGVRGSRPKHKPNLLKFGGNSTSIEFVTNDKMHLFLDGGSGLAHCRQKSKASNNHQFNFLITHTHWDHLLGLPYFKPFYAPKSEFHFYAADTQKATFEKLFNGLFSADQLPIPLATIKAKIHFHSIKPDSQYALSETVNFQTYQLNHQGITLGYRVNCKERSAIVITDNAPIQNGNFMGEGMLVKANGNPAAFEEKFNAGLVNFLAGADLVIFDTHFTEQNIKPDWGHSTPERALAFCLAAKVKHLVLFHHAPEDTDRDVEKKVASISEQARTHGIKVSAATEGSEWDLAA